MYVCLYLCVCVYVCVHVCVFVRMCACDDFVHAHVLDFLFEIIKHILPSMSATGSQTNDAKNTSSI